MSLKTKNNWFVDEKGRKILLRGVNLGGSTKVPKDPDGATHIETDFSDHRDVSFVGRPFPLDEAHEHLSRIKHWGFNTLRLLTIWEAIEHKGPGIYDTSYLDYFQEVVELAGDYDLFVFIDPHQDVWSRMTGGDGAPGWTFEKVGLDFTTFDKNGAAKVMQYHYPHDYEPMEWSFNWRRFGCATMFSLFFGSEAFAPEMKVDGVSTQSYLQGHFINAMTQVAERVKDFEHVIGFDSLNEPNPGFIGIDNLGKFPDFTPPGLNFTPFDAIASGSGIPREGRQFKLKFLWLKEVDRETINPEGISSWIDDDLDVWRNHGIWSKNGDDAILLAPDHFSTNPDGTKVDFFRDYLRPFIVKYTRKIRKVIPDTLIFLEGDPQDPRIYWEKGDPAGVVNASHWYDGFTLFTKTFRRWLTVNITTQKPVLFHSRVYSYLLSQVAKLKQVSQNIHGGVPTLVGEFGIPYDMNNAKAYQTGNFKHQVQALNMYYNILDELQINSTQWNYTPDNSNSWGDKWNMEDLSIFSRDQQEEYSDLDSGGRAIAGFCRPYPRYISGEPRSWSFNLDKRRFQFSYLHHGSEYPTVVYVPKFHYPNGVIVNCVPKIDWTYSPGEQLLRLKSDNTVEISLEIFPS